jgi:hypothetical protein
MTTPVPEHPPLARRYPTARPNPNPGTVPLGQAFNTLPEGGYPDFGETGLAYAAGQRAAARAQENRTALTTSSGAPDTDTMYPTAYGQSSSNSDASDGGTATNPDAAGNVGNAVDEQNKQAKKDKKGRRRGKQTGRKAGK